MDIRFVLQKAQKARKETKPIGLYKKLKKVIKKNMRKVLASLIRSEIFALNNQMDIRTAHAFSPLCSVQSEPYSPVAALWSNI